MRWKFHQTTQVNVASLTVTFSLLHYNVIQLECEAISG